MIVRTLEETIGTEADVRQPTFNARRILLARDGAGFSMHDTLLYAGAELHLWYKNHIEAVYCIDSTGTLEDLDNGKTYDLGPGSLYALNGNERHIIRPRTEMRVICVFNPPLTGGETHDADGAYPVLTE